MEGVSALQRHPPASVADAAAAVRRDGAAVIEGLWDVAAIDVLRETVLEQHPEFREPALLRDYQGDKDRRFTAPVVISQAVRAGRVFAPALEAVCAELLGEDFVFEAFGMLMVNPGAEAQVPHRDGGLLFNSGVDSVLPPSALTLVVPLVDVDRNRAPTGVLLGSHRAPANPEANSLIPVEVRRGDLVVWDFRMIHAGLANRTQDPRPALYLTACRPFWIDHKNFGGTGRIKLVAEARDLAELGPRFVRAQVTS